MDYEVEHVLARRIDIDGLDQRLTGPDFCASCNSMWGQLMYRLKGFVEGNVPGPQWTE
jgi:hypothetical protein